MPEIGRYKFIKKFAWLPVRFFFFNEAVEKQFHQKKIWLKFYYKVYRYDYLTWAIPPRIDFTHKGDVSVYVAGWLMEHGRFVTLNNTRELLRDASDVEKHIEKERIRYDEKVESVKNDKWLQGFMAANNAY